MTTPSTETLAQGRFQLLEVLGEGGMAKVYRAFDRRLQRYRAIKILAPHLAQRDSLRRRFLAEAQTMATLEESRVVRVFDMGEDEGRVYIVMELVEGGSLVDRINGGGPLPPQLTAQVGLQIAESLHVAHLAGVIHRDIKPHNILLTKTGEIRITDFGIAQVQTEDGDGMTRTGAVMGTWGFMAPEQRNNAKGVDARADVFSTGATLWALLRGETPAELYAEEDAFHGIVEPLAGVLRTATRYRREDRYASAQGLADALREALTALPPDPEFVPPLVLPKEWRAPQSKETATMDPSGEDLIPLGTMVPDHGPDPSLTLKRPSSDPPTAGHRASVPPPGGVSPPPPPGQGSLPTPGLPSLHPPGRHDVAPPTSARPGVWMVGITFAVLAVAGAGLLATAVWVVHRGQQVATGEPAEPVVDVIVAAGTPAPELALPDAALPDAALPDAALPDAALPDAALPDVVVAKAPTAPPKPDVGKGASTPKEAAPVAASETTPEVVARVPAAASPEAALQHSPPSSMAAGGSVTLTATGASNWTVKVYYRPASGGGYSNKLMNASGASYSTTLKATDDLAGGIEYFLQAITPVGALKDGSASAPHRILVQ